MAVDVSKLIITEIVQITAFNNAGELEFIMDEVQEGSIKGSQEKTDITGRRGRKIASLKKNKSVTVSATNGLLVGGALAAQTGSDVEQGSFLVRVSDVMTVNNGSCALSKTPAANMIETIYMRNENGTLGEKLTRVDTASADAAQAKTQFTYKADTREITVSGIENGSQLVAFYDVEAEAAKISNDAERYSKVLKLYIDVVLQDSCDREYAGQIVIDRADVSGEFELSLGGENFAHAFEAESLTSGCSGSAKLWDLIVYGED